MKEISPFIFKHKKKIIFVKQEFVIRKIKKEKKKKQKKKSEKTNDEIQEDLKRIK